MAVARIEKLRVELPGAVDVVDDISLEIGQGEVVALVGESGSGKTTIGTSMLAHARSGARIVRGTVTIDGDEILELSPDGQRALRGKTVAYIPQEPAAALNPAIRIGRQLEEVIIDHEPGVARPERDERVRGVLGDVGLPVTEEFVRRYPHQLSGGQQQRVAIAMAIILAPRLLVLDEPTTGLDVTTQARILAIVRTLCSAQGIAALYVTHDLAVVREIADRVIVLYAGRVAESGRVDDVFRRPAHPYTLALLGAVPDIARRTSLVQIPGRAARPGERPSGCFFHPRCPIRVERCQSGEVPTVTLAPGHLVRCHRADQAAQLEARKPSPPRPVRDRQPLLTVERVNAVHGVTRVLHDVSLSVDDRACVALVGESGSGKTTLSQCIIGLHEKYTGTIKLRDKQLARSVRDRSREARRTVQYIFQSPYNSLNPRRTIGEIVGLPLQLFFRSSRREMQTQIDAGLERVGLSAGLAGYYPDQLSGGERQRVSIARALVCQPEVLICDEVTSALDVSVQAAIVELLRGLQQESGLSLLFVTHNLALVRNIADEVIVLSNGRVVESGETESVLDAPQQAYTKQLITDTPSVERASEVTRAS
ncbi:MAG TPA: ABC transporter ATP-binding protein [Solirubrobacteraceae bacterium]|nr:ABC transporter ATP-binding protein [Solirubrobacteraceae bacterium]